MEESSGRNRNLGHSRLNPTSLTLNSGSGLGGDVLREASPDKGPQDQPQRRTNTRVGEVVESLKNSAVELNWNQRTRRTCREVAEDGGGSGGNRDNTDRRVLKRFVVGEQGKISTFQEETEVSHSSRVSSQELMVEGGVTGLGGGQLLGEESQRSPGSTNQMLKNRSHL